LTFDGWNYCPALCADKSEHLVCATDVADNSLKHNLTQKLQKTFKAVYIAG
jgi:hypothetical protein